jgi:hypothetical protein
MSTCGTSHLLFSWWRIIPKHVAGASERECKVSALFWSSAEFLDNGMLSTKLKCVHFRICVSGEVTALSSPRWRRQTSRCWIYCLPSTELERSVTRPFDPFVNRFVPVSVALRNIPYVLTPLKIVSLKGLHFSAAHYCFLGAFTEQMRWANVRFDPAVCLSVCSRPLICLPLEGFTRTCTFEMFTKIFQCFRIFVKIGQK